MSLIDRYCSYQFFVMLSIGTTIPGGIYLLTADVQRLLRYVAEAGCPIDLLVMMTALQIPSTVVTCLPAGILMATVLSLHFMNADAELIALRSAGIAVTRVFRPFLIIGFVCAVMSFFIAENLVPDALKLSNHIALSAVNKRELPAINGIHDYVGYDLGKDGRMNTIFLVASREGRKLFNNVIIDLSSTSSIRLIWAPTGLFKNQNWNLFNGHIYDLSAAQDDENIQHQHFGTFLIGPPNLSQFDPHKREPRPYEMNSKALKAKIESLKLSSKPVPPETYLEYYRRFTDPLACLLLVIAALPVVLVDRRTRSMAGLIYGSVMLVAYFTLQAIVSGAASAGAMNPLLAACLPGASLFICGLGFLLFRWRRL